MVLSQEFDLSHKRLVAKRKTLVKNGESFYEALESGCGGVYPSLSDWSGGVWLDVPDCFFDDELPDAAATLYSFKLPEARYYHRLILDAYGYSTLGDDLAGFFLRGSELEFVGLVAGSTPAVRIFGSKKAEGLVNDRNRVRVMLFLFSFCDCVEVDYDIGSVGVTVRYGVLD